MSWLLERLAVWTSYWRDLLVYVCYVTGRDQSTSNQNRAARLRGYISKCQQMWIPGDLGPASGHAEYSRPSVGVIHIVCIHIYISLV